MKASQRIFNFTVLLVITLRSYSQPLYHLQSNQILNDILYLRFDKASREIESVQKSGIDNPEFLYLNNYLEFLENMIEGNSSHYQAYKKHSGKRIRQIEKSSQDNFAALRYQSEINFQSFILAAYHKENFTALKHFLLSSNQINDYLESTNYSVQGYRIKGLITILLASIPDEYSGIASLLGINEKLDTGMNMLEQYSLSCKNNRPEYLESIILLAFVRHLFIRNYDENLKYLQNMPAVYLENPLFRLAYLLSASRAGQNDLVINLLDKYSQRKDEHQLCFFNFIKGEALLNRLDIMANKPLLDFIKCSDNGIYSASAYRKLAWCSLLGNDTTEFYKFHTCVLNSDNLLVEADYQAVNEFTNQGIPNVDLLRARLLFDGGYYQQAKEILLNQEVRNRLKNVYEQVEYTYRLARIYHMTGESVKAIRLYQLALDKGENYLFYYAGNSALQLGIIYENLDDRKKAEHYYHKVLEFKESTFGYQFRHDAREGLRRLNN